VEDDVGDKGMREIPIRSLIPAESTASKPLAESNPARVA
jgi:hypothetical protein